MNSRSSDMKDRHYRLVLSAITVAILATIGQPAAADSRGSEIEALKPELAV
jgi:hypothetical protein